MPRPEPPQQQSALYDTRSSFNLLYFIAEMHSACIRPFTRSHVGTRGMGLRSGVGALFLILAYAQYTDAPEMIAYLRAWLAMTLLRRVTADRRQHTDYQGWPWLFPFLRNEQTARLLEAGSLWVIGGALAGFSEAMGRFVAAGAFSFGFKYAIDRITLAHLKDAAHNARIEMEYMQRGL